MSVCVWGVGGWGVGGGKWVCACAFLRDCDVLLKYISDVPCSVVMLYAAKSISAWGTTIKLYRIVLYCIR